MSLRIVAVLFAPLLHAVWFSMTLYFTNVERHISHDLNPGK